MRQPVPEPADDQATVVVEARTLVSPARHFSTRPSSSPKLAMSSYGSHVPSGRAGQPARIVPTIGVRPTKATAAPSRPRRQSVPTLPSARPQLHSPTTTTATATNHAPKQTPNTSNGVSHRPVTVGTQPRPTEATPLLPPDDKPRLHGLVGLNRPPTVWTETNVLIKSSIPLAAGLMLENALSTINALVVSRLGATELAVCGNSSLLVMVTGYPLPLALAAAFTTLSAPLFTQIEARHHIGHYLQRTLLLSLLTGMVTALFWWNISPILLKLKQPVDVVAGMKSYMRASTLLLPGLGLVECMKAYLQVQGMMMPPPIVLLILLPFHTVFCIYLVHYTHLEATGAALASAGTLTVTGLLLVVYALRTRARQCWEGFSHHAWHDWPSILWLAIPGALMFGSELWAFEVIALLAGRLGKIAVAAQAVINIMDSIVAMVPYAISIAIANRVGNLLGFGTRAIKRARRTIRGGFIIEIVVTGLTGLTLLIFRQSIVRIFTDDKEVAREAADALVFVASYQVFDGLQNVGAACLRAFGRQNVGSVIHLIGYYMVGLPLGAWLGLGRGWGLAGLWAGAAIALACTAAAELAFAFSINWEAEVVRMQQREADEDEGDDEDSSDDDVA